MGKLSFENTFSCLSENALIVRDPPVAEVNGKVTGDKQTNEQQGR